MHSLLITGGAGFIGSALVRFLVNEGRYRVAVLDALTYAGNLDSLAGVVDSPRLEFHKGDIRDAQTVRDVLARTKPVGVIHLAAESHVDRSIDAPAIFLETNIIGTHVMLDEARSYLARAGELQPSFRFLHVSTDEVFGSLGPEGRFTETSAFAPNSPYAASKAAADHLARAWHHTFGFPVITTNCSNNYGPYQFPEKLIPLVISRAKRKQSIPVYGTGDNIRDWLHVDDHVRGLMCAFERGKVGATYNIGGNAERTNLEVVRSICDILDEECGDTEVGTRRGSITFVTDRPAHDRRYAIDASKIRTELGWEPQVQFSEGLRQTVRWYLDNEVWTDRVQSGAYQGERLGLGGAR